MRNAITGVAVRILAAGCSKLTAENYAKVKMGMSYNEVRRSSADRLRATTPPGSRAVAGATTSATSRCASPATR
jgi:hypothetical protein